MMVMIKMVMNKTMEMMMEKITRIRFLKKFINLSIYSIFLCKNYGCQNLVLNLNIVQFYLILLKFDSISTLYNFATELERFWQVKLQFY